MKMLQSRRVWTALCVATLVVSYYYLRERTLGTHIAGVSNENAVVVDLDLEEKSTRVQRMFSKIWKLHTVIDFNSPGTKTNTEENPENHADFLYKRKTTCDSEDGSGMKCSCPDFSSYTVAEGRFNNK